MSPLSTIPFLRSKSKVPRQVISTSWDESKQILEEDVNLFCWKRSINDIIRKFLPEVLEKHPKPIKVSVNQDDLHYQLESAKIIWEDAEISDCPAFWRDLSKLVYDFLAFSETKSGVVHLRVVENDACTKFHIDGYRLRLFTTYFGKGTEWLPEEAVNRQALGTENKKIVKDKLKIQRTETGHVNILKGELANQAQFVKGIVHRSPRITHVGEKRIILRVDI